MLSVFATGGKQYLAETGNKIKIEKIKANEGDTVTFDQVLLIAKGENQLEIGSPFVVGQTVQAKVIKQGKYRTVRVEKFKNKTRYHKVHGQRQRYTEIEII